MIEKLQKENFNIMYNEIRAQNDLVSQDNQIAKVKQSSAQRSLIKATEEIKLIKKSIEEEKEAQRKLQQDIDILEKVSILKSSNIFIIVIRTALPSKKVQTTPMNAKPSSKSKSGSLRTGLIKQTRNLTKL